MQEWLLDAMLMLLKICDGLMNTISVFIGAKHIAVGDKHLVLIDMLLENHIVKSFFFGAFISGIAFVLIFSMVSVIKNNRDNDNERHSAMQVIRRLTKSLCIYILVPVFIFAFIHGVSALVLQIEHIVDSNTSESKQTLGNSLFMMISFGQEKAIYNVENPSFTDEVRFDFFYNNELYYNREIVDKYFEFSTFSKVTGVISSIVLLVIMVVAIMTFVKGIFDLLVLFVFSPYLAATVPLDNGERFKKWIITFMAKLGSDFGVIITFKIFINIILAVIVKGEVTFSPITIFNTGIMVMLLIGGCLAVVNSHEFMIELLGEQMEKVGRREAGKN